MVGGPFHAETGVRVFGAGTYISPEEIRPDDIRNESMRELTMSLVNAVEAQREGAQGVAARAAPVREGQPSARRRER